MLHLYFYNISFIRKKCISVAYILVGGSSKLRGKFSGVAKVPGAFSEVEGLGPLARKFFSYWAPSGPHIHGGP